MKKSFLKRVTAAVIALPVALSQTVLFASFAAGESNAVEAINIDSFLTVPASQALYTPQGDEVYRALGAQQTKDGNNSNYQYFIQESNWNAKLSQAVLSYSGLVDEENNVHTFDLDATEFIQYINGDTWYADMIRNALADPVNQAYVNVYSDGIDFVAHVNNYSYEKFAMDILNRSIPESYKNVDFTFQSDGAVDAKVVISADTTALGDGAGKAARTVPYTIEIEWDGKKLTTVQQVYDKILSVIEQVRQDTKDSVAAKFKTYEDEKEAAQKALDDAKAEGAPADVIAEKQAELDAKANKLDNAHRMVDFKVDEIVDDYVERINNAKQKYDNQIAKDLDREVTKEDVDAVLGRLNQIVENNVNNQRVNNAFPANLSEFAGKNYYGTLNKIFYNVLEQINKQTGEKSTSGTVYNINLTLQEVLDKAAELYDVTVYDKHVAGEESIDGYAYAYLDEDEDTAPIEKLINEKLAAENLKLKENSLYTIKAVEVEGDGDIQNGSSVLDVYRIIRFETEEVEETTTASETTTETTETTASTEATEETTETTASTEATSGTTGTTAATTESGEGTGTTVATTESGEGTGTTAATTESGEGTGTTAATTESGEGTGTTAATTESGEGTGTTAATTESGEGTGTTAATTESGEGTGTTAATTESGEGTGTTAATTESGGEALEQQQQLMNLVKALEQQQQLLNLVKALEQQQQLLNLVKALEQQ